MIGQVGHVALKRCPRWWGTHILAICWFVWLGNCLLTAKTNTKDDAPITLVTPNVTLEKGQKTFEAWLMFLVKGPHQNKELTVKAVDVSQQPEKGRINIEVKEPKCVADGAQGEGRYWKVRLTATGLTHGEQVSRYLMTDFKDSSVGPFALPYTLKLPALKWKIYPPPEKWRPARIDKIEFSVGADFPIKPLKIVQSTLLRSDGEAIHAQDLELELFVGAADCAEGSSAEDCPESGEFSDDALTPNSVTPVHLRFRAGKEKLVGEFEGKVYIAASGDAIPQEFELNVARRDSGYWWKGLGAILVGILLSGLGTSVLIRKLARKNALLPVQRLRDLLAQKELEIEAAQGKVESPLHTLTEKTHTLQDALSTRELDARGFLPKKMFGQGDPDTGGFKTYMDAQRRDLDNLTLILDNGVKPMVRDWTNVPASNKKDAAELLQDIQMTVHEDDSTVIESALDQLLARFRKLLAPVAFHRASAAAPAAGREPLGWESLRVEIAVLSLLAFGIWVILTLVVGWYIWIDANPGFGLWQDYLLAFLWGFGLPTVGGQIQLLTPASIADSFLVTVPKVV